MPIAIATPPISTSFDALYGRPYARLGIYSAATAEPEPGPTPEPAAEAADLAVVNALIAAGLATDATVFRGPLRAAKRGMIPTDAAFVLLAGGGGNRPYMNGRSDFRQLVIVVALRSSADDFGVGQAKGLAMIEALHRAEIPGYAYCLVDQPVPAYVGEDEEAGHVWSFTVRMGLKHTDAA